MIEMNTQFEYPLPVIKTSTDKIYAEFPSTAGGSFKIKNTGGGELSGNITSNSRFITFTPDTFDGNDVVIDYNVSLPSRSIGEIIRTEVLISSNGGEISLPVVIKITTEAMEAPDGTIIATLRDFHGFSKKSPREAVRLFFSDEFMRWLSAIGFEHMEMALHMREDSIGERGLDNFLILTGQKKKTGTFIDGRDVDIELNPYESDKIAGKLKIKKSGWGYVDDEIFAENGSDWLSVSKDRITPDDFDENDEMEISYTADPKLIQRQAVYDTITLNSETVTRTDINIRIKPLIKIKLSSESYYFNDEGHIYIENNSGREIRVEITPKDSFIKLEGRAYNVSENAKIPFNVKMSLINQKQMDFKRKPYIESEIYIRAYTGDSVIQKTEKFLVGYALLD